MTRWWKGGRALLVLALGLALVGAGCTEDCPPSKEPFSEQEGKPACAYGYPGQCCSDAIWAAVCVAGEWTCPPGGGYPGGILREQCRVQGCPSRLTRPDGGGRRRISSGCR